jgi:ABC-type Fe3+ transport system permease subunit
MRSRLEDALSYFKRDESRLRRIGKLILLVVAVCVLALGVESLLGDVGTGAPSVNEATGLYEEGPTNWGLCAVFVVMGVVLIAAFIIETGR